MMAGNNFFFWFAVFAVVFNSLAVGFLTHDLLGEDEVVFVEDDLASVVLSECDVVVHGQCLDMSSRWFGCDVFSRQCYTYCKAVL